MPGPNDVLACPSDSARRRHAARGRSCRTCDSVTRRVEDTARARLAQENRLLRARLADADRALTALLASPVIRPEALAQAHRRLASTATSRRRAS